MNTAASRLGKLAAALDADSDGAHWALTRPRAWKLATLEDALRLTRQVGLPDGVEAAPPATHYGGDPAAPDCSFPAIADLET